MPKISSYPTVTPTGSDLVLIADTSGTGNPTKTATVSSINALNNDETLQDVLDANNTATEDINLTGNIALTGNLTGTGGITRTGNVVLTGDLTGTGDITRTGDIALTGDLTGAGNITRTGDIALTGAQTISTTLGVTGTTTLGVLSLSSISGGWTNAGNTIADLGTVTTADINGGTWQGTIDGSWTAAGQTCADLGTVTTADINGGNIDGTVIGNSVDAAGTFTNLVASTMDGIIGSVTPQAGTFSTLIGTNIDGTIGANTPAVGTFTRLVSSGNLVIDTDTLFADATLNRVGIGTATPNNTLELEGSSGDIIIEMDNNAAGSSNFQIQCGAGNARADLVLDNNLHITMKGQRVGIIDTSPSYTLDVNGDGRFTTDFNVDGTATLINAVVDTSLIAPTSQPASDSAAGTTGQIAITADYIYICTATNTWRRIQVTGSGW